LLYRFLVCSDKSGSSKRRKQNNKFFLTSMQSNSM